MPHFNLLNTKNIYILETKLSKAYLSESNLGYYFLLENKFFFRKKASIQRVNQLQMNKLFRNKQALHGITFYLQTEWTYINSGFSIWVRFWVSFMDTRLCEMCKIYEVSLRIQSECGKMRTRKNCVFGHFPRSTSFTKT